MKLRDFRRAGHAPTLFAAFLYFDVSFMVWVLIGSLANSIVPELGLSEAQKGLMVAVPLLGGAMLRLVLGVLTDQIGARRTGMLGMALTIIGAGYGLGRIGSAAMEGMARQPEVAPRIQTAMIIIAAMLEGATLASVILCYLIGSVAKF